MAKSHKITTEEKFVARLTDMLSDLRLDLDMVGLYFGRYARLTIYRRLEHIYEVAREHRQNTDSREAHNEYIENLHR
jgi:hypothetical protein